MRDDDLSDAEKLHLLASVPGDVGTASRLVAAFADGDSTEAKCAIDEIASSGREMYVLSATAMLASRLAFELAPYLGATAQQVLAGVVLQVHQEVDNTKGEITD